MPDTKISTAGGETGGPAETADLTTTFLRKDGLYTNPLASPTITGTVNGGNFDPGPYLNGYLAENFPLWHATSTFTTTSTDVYVSRFYSGGGGLFSYADIWCTTLNSGTITHAYAALYTMAGAQVAASTDIEAAFTGTGIQTFTWSSAVNLAAGTFYYVAYAIADTTAAPTLLAAPTGAGINANLASHVFNYATYSTSTTIPASITPSSLTGTTTTPAWIGLR